MPLRSLSLCCLLLAVGGCSQQQEPATTLSPAVRVVRLLSSQQNDDALRLCNESLAVEPDNVVLLLLRAEVHQRHGQLDAALADCNQAQHIQPHHQQAGRQAARLRDLQESRASLVFAKPVADLVADRADDSANSADNSARIALSSRLPESQAAKLTSVTSSVGQSFPDDKAYRRLPSPAVDRNAPPPKKSPPQPTATELVYRQLMAGLADADLQQASERQSLDLDRADWTGPPMDDPSPQQIVRFDLGIGQLSPFVSQLPMRTTGRRSCGILGCRVERPRRGQFMGQNIPPQRQPSSARSVLCFPSDMVGQEEAGTRNTPKTCADQVDNNGDGVSDRNDPMCWRDPFNPASYSADLQEVTGPATFLSPLASSPLSSLAVPAQPSVAPPNVQFFK